MLGLASGPMTALDIGEGPGLPVVHIIHDNPEWIPPFASALAAAGVPYREWTAGDSSFDLAGVPPRGVFWSRLSASAHTRGRPLAKEYGRAVLEWLHDAGRRVINGRAVLDFEVSKVRQYLALSRAGFEVPRTIAVLGRDPDELAARARDFTGPFITKHNQGGKGIGVRRFEGVDDFRAFLVAPERDEPVDGITLLQEYVRPAEPFITRAEFVGGRFHYAVRVDISAGSFQLCPADACAVRGGTEATAAPGIAPAACARPDAPSVFSWRRDVDGDDPFIRRLEGFLTGHGIEIAGVEFIETDDGRRVVYDVNTNTNYNSAVEDRVPVPAATAVARFLRTELARVAPPAFPLRSSAARPS